MNLSEIKTLEELAAKIKSLDMVTSVPRTDYSGTSTIVGWSGYTTKEIWYSKVGKKVFVWFDITGTSDATTASFTLPYSNNADVLLSSFMAAQDNGSWVSSWCSIATSAAVVICYPSVGGASSGWTNSGTKTVRGHFVFETA